MGDDIFMEEERARGGERRSTEAFEPEVLRVFARGLLLLLLLLLLISFVR